MAKKLNEAMYTTQQLKNFARSYNPKSTLEVSNIKGIDYLQPDGLRSRAKYDLEKYNKYVDKYNKLLSNMKAGRVRDEMVSKAMRDLKLFKNKAEKVYENDIANWVKKASEAQRKGKIGARIKRGAEQEASRKVSDKEWKTRSKEWDKLSSKQRKSAKKAAEHTPSVVARTQERQKRKQRELEKIEKKMTKAAIRGRHIIKRGERREQWKDKAKRYVKGVK